MPESRTASFPAAMASWMKRLIRRAIFASITVVGSKSRTSAAIRTSNADASKLLTSRVPVTPATRFDQYVSKSLPIGMIAPSPVTTARRAGSCSGGNAIPHGQTHPALVVKDRRTSVPVVALEDDRAVMSAEADVVGERVPDRDCLGLLDDPQVAVGIGVSVVD